MIQMRQDSELELVEVTTVRLGVHFEVTIDRQQTVNSDVFQEGSEKKQSQNDAQILVLSIEGSINFK